MCIRDRVYVVEDILATMRKENPDKDVQAIELRLLEHLRSIPLHDPMAKPVEVGKILLDKGKIIATGTEKRHQVLEKEIGRLQKNGFRQIVLETRFVAIPKGLATDFAWTDLARPAT